MAFDTGGDVATEEPAAAVEPQAEEGK